MYCRQNDPTTIDCPSIRSIWDDSKASLAARFSNRCFNDRSSHEFHGGDSIPSFSPPSKGSYSLPKASNLVGSTKNILGGYDCAAPGATESITPSWDSTSGYGLPYSGKQTHRSSISSWDHSTVSGQSSPPYTPGGISDLSSESSSPSFCSSNFYDNHFERHDKDHLDLITKALRSLIMNNHTSPTERDETINAIMRLSTLSRRATVCNGALALNREKFVPTNPSRFFSGESLTSSNASSYANLSNLGSNYSLNSNLYEVALERIEREAKLRRTSAYHTDTNFTWKGTLATQFHPNPTYATKVFVGGLPYDVTPEALTELFGQFGLISVQFPPRGRGHAYLVFETEQQVQNLLKACEDKGPGQFFFWVESRRGKHRQAQIIPWPRENSDWVAPTHSEPTSPTSSVSSDSANSFDSVSGSRVESRSLRDQTSSKKNTVFVGALHGEITAAGLQNILSDLFGPVLHVGIDTDKTSYPNGSARVTFAKSESFHRAVLAEFVQVVTPRFSKIIQLDAYIEDGSCVRCKVSTPVFCRHPSCFNYYCPSCFEDHRTPHSDYHPPVMRNRNNNNNGNQTFVGSSSSSVCTFRNKDRAHTV